VQDGTALNVLQELGGWETPEKGQRYAHLAVGHLADYAGRSGPSVANDNRAKSPGIAANDQLGTLWAQAKDAAPELEKARAQVQENKGIRWCRQRDSNPRPPDYKSRRYTTRLAFPLSNSST